ncbi:hypothetical protein GCM10022286_09240 [Gryllotalpicola daejeonensis]|uniref:K Homology domain-containing protein n=1 Tax=Gryllotalpicola daejeonensis TaxID=993087 RepID=A0ABP7ZHA0_9MICO
MTTLIVVVVLLFAGILTWLLVRSRRRRPARAARALSLTPHAQQRMAERHVAASQILSVVVQPDRVVPTEYADFGAWGGPALKDSVRLEGEIDGRVLKVWVPTPWPPPVRTVVVKSVAWSEFVDTVRVPQRSVGRVIGRSGVTITAIERNSGANVSHVGGGVFRITAEDARAVGAAKRAVQAAAR